MWLQQDGAPAHGAIMIRNYPNQIYPQRWMGRFGPLPWPARSPDLNPLDFFFWGAMKELVNSTPVIDEQDLIARIAAAALLIKEKPDVFDNVREAMTRRCNACIQANAGNFEHIL